MSKAGIDSRRFPTDSSEDVDAVVTYLEEILSILVHSHLLQSASLKCPLERIEKSAGGNRQSTSEVSVTKKFVGDHQKEEERVQVYVEGRQVIKILDPYNSLISGSYYANHSGIVGSDGLSGLQPKESEQKISSSGAGPCFSSFACPTLVRDTTSLTRIADVSSNRNRNIGSAKNRVRTDHLLYGNEDPKTISLQSSTDFIRHLKSRRRVHDGS